MAGFIHSKINDFITPTMKHFFLYALLFFCINSYSQQLKGKVIDEYEEPVSMAMVQLLQNNQIVQYTMTDANGVFVFNNVVKGNYTLIANHFSYEKLMNAISVENDLDTTLILTSKGEELPTIEIAARASLATVKGDTITYNLRAATDGTEEKLRDVLKKLPGVEVNAVTGKISANGKVVDDLMINGQSLFGKNHKLATENINAEMLDGVSLISNFEKFTALKDVEGSEKTALNIDIKKEYLGKITGDNELFAALKNRYKLHSKLFQFNKKNSLSVIANSNNTGEESLSFF